NNETSRVPIPKILSDSLAGAMAGAEERLTTAKASRPAGLSKETWAAVRDGFHSVWKKIHSGYENAFPRRNPYNALKYYLAKAKGVPFTDLVLPALRAKGEDEETVQAVMTEGRKQVEAQTQAEFDELWRGYSQAENGLSYATRPGVFQAQFIPTPGVGG